ncbi:MAG: carbon-nitrogen hydrolase family protein [Anaerovoracaceae bacterium]|jgi:omega-amidase
MPVIKIAQVQMHSCGSRSEAVEEACNAVARAAAMRADIVCLPEMFLTHYDNASMKKDAVPEDGYELSRLADTAARYGVYLQAGTVPEAAEGSLYNTAYLFDRSGTQIAKHRKMHLFDVDIKGGQSFSESSVFSAGDEITVAGTEFGRIGLAICYDIRFPELFRLMALKGAKLVIVPASFNSTTGPAHWQLCFRSEAMYNQFFIAGTASAFSPDSSYHAYGHSIICGPWGEVLGELDENPGMLMTEINTDITADVRNQLPILKNRRTDIYDIAEIRAPEQDF